MAIISLLTSLAGETGRDGLAILVVVRDHLDAVLRDEDG